MARAVMLICAEKSTDKSVGPVFAQTYSALAPQIRSWGASRTHTALHSPQRFSSGALRFVCMQSNSTLHVWTAESISRTHPHPLTQPPIHTMRTKGMHNRVEVERASDVSSHSVHGHILPESEPYPACGLSSSELFGSGLFSSGPFNQYAQSLPSTNEQREFVSLDQRMNTSHTWLVTRGFVR